MDGTEAVNVVSMPLTREFSCLSTKLTALQKSLDRLANNAHNRQEERWRCIRELSDAEKCLANVREVSVTQAVVFVNKSAFYTHVDNM